MPPLSFSLPFALKRKNISLLRLKAKHPPVFISLPERNLTPFALKRKNISLIGLKAKSPFVSFKV